MSVNIGKIEETPKSLYGIELLGGFTMSICKHVKMGAKGLEPLRPCGQRILSP